MIDSFVFVLKYFHKFLTVLCLNVYDKLHVSRGTCMGGFGAESEIKFRNQHK